LFVKRLLRKSPSERPTATEALADGFMAEDNSDLMQLYRELVVSSWRGRDVIDDVLLRSVPEQDSQVEVLSEMDETAEAAESLMALAERDVNLQETKERKRPYADGKENDSQTSEEEPDLRKRRKFDG
jgi:hypothetical protein